MLHACNSHFKDYLEEVIFTAPSSPISKLSNEGLFAQYVGELNIEKGIRLVEVNIYHLAS